MEPNSLEIIFVTDEMEDKLIIEKLKKSNMVNKVIFFQHQAEADNFICNLSVHDGGTNPCTKLFLLDLTAPDLDAPAMIGKLKSLKHTQRIAVLILIPSKKDRAILEQHELDVDGYLMKPIDVKEFNRTLLKLRFSWFLFQNTCIGQE